MTKLATISDLLNSPMAKPRIRESIEKDQRQLPDVLAPTLEGWDESVGLKSRSGVEPKPLHSHRLHVEANRLPPAC